MKEIMILAKDRIGLLADITYILGSARINIEGLSAYTVNDNAVLYLRLKEDKKAKELLEKNGFKVLDANTILVKLVNRPGEMSKIARMLADNKINIHSVLFIGEKEGNHIYALVVDQNRKLRTLLKDYIVNEEEIE